MILLLNIVRATVKLNLFGMDLLDSDKASINILVPKIFLEDLKAKIELSDGTKKDFKLDYRSNLVANLGEYKSFTVLFDLFGIEKEYKYEITVNEDFFKLFEFPLNKIFEKLKKLRDRLENITDLLLNDKTIFKKACNQYHSAFLKALENFKDEVENCFIRKSLVSKKTSLKNLYLISNFEEKTYDRIYNIISNLKSYEEKVYEYKDIFNKEKKINSLKKDVELLTNELEERLSLSFKEKKDRAMLNLRLHKKN